MNINAKKAQDKLSQELSAAKLGKYAQAVAKPTLEVLKTFCEQNEEFAQAVLQTDRTFAECKGKYFGYRGLPQSCKLLLQGCGRSFQYDYRPG